MDRRGEDSASPLRFGPSFSEFASNRHRHHLNDPAHTPYIMLSTSLLPTLKTGTSSLSRLALPTASASSRLVRSPSSLFPSPPSSSARSYSDSSQVDPLHYHPLPPPSRKLAISFLDLPPRSSRSATILGFLPADDPNATLADFVESKAFATTLHRAVKESLAEGEQRMESEAQGRGEGWIHVNGELILIECSHQRYGCVNRYHGLA
jgi:hypothetical protein